MAVPAIDKLDIDEEDSVALESKHEAVNRDITIAVLQTPKISNFTDFDALAYEPDVSVRFVRPGDSIGKPDLVIIPGSKNTLADLDYLQKNGYAAEIKALHEQGTPVLGICGGNQMLGQRLLDPDGAEGDIPELEGLGLLPTETHMTGTKLTHQVTFSRNR